MIFSTQRSVIQRKINLETNYTLRKFLKMGNITNNSFEEQWQKAFDNASLPPSEAVWERIELDLENNILPKSGNGLYYIGVISAVILGVSSWLFINKNEVKKQIQVIENKAIISSEKIEKSAFKKEEKLISKPKEISQIKKVFVPEKEEIIEPDILVKEPENEVRIINDSIDFMNPIMTTKKVNFELINPNIIIPFEQTPYYEIPKPITKKKSIWDRIRISGGVGVYQ